MQDKRPLHQI